MRELLLIFSFHKQSSIHSMVKYPAQGHIDVNVGELRLNASQRAPRSALPGTIVYWLFGANTPVASLLVAFPECRFLFVCFVLLSLNFFSFFLSEIRVKNRITPRFTLVFVAITLTFWFEHNIKIVSLKNPKNIRQHLQFYFFLIF